MAREASHLHALGAGSAAGASGRRAYSDAFKADAVAKARAAQSVAHVARELGVARNTLMAWVRDAVEAPAGLLAAVRSGNRRAYLEASRDELARKIESGVSAKDLPPNLRMLNEIMRELEELNAPKTEGGGARDDDSGTTVDEAWDAEAI